MHASLCFIAGYHISSFSALMTSRQLISMLHFIVAKVSTIIDCYRVLISAKGMEAFPLSVLTLQEESIVVCCSCLCIGVSVHVSVHFVFRLTQGF